MKTIRARKGGAQMSQTPYAQAHSYDYKHCEEGKIYHVVQEFGRANGLVQIRLSHDAGIRWIKEDEWEVISSGASRSEDAAREGKLLNLPEIPSEGPPQRSIQIAEQTPLCPHETLQWASGRPNKLVYYAQRDNYRDANRSCFSSCCAMLLKFAKPDSIKSDDEYLKRVFEFGDTVNAETQIKALESYGVKALFETNCSIEKLQYHVCGKTGQPAAIGLLHRGNYLKPDVNKSHYVVCSGYDYASDRFEIQDPWLDEYDWKEGVHNGFQDGVNQWWPSDALKYRFTVESKNGHYSSGWWLRIID